MKASQANTLDGRKPPEPDVRVCFIGDSFVAGVGDSRHLGWAGRLAAHSHAPEQALTSYNLGIRRDTSADILRRFQAECTPRLPSGSHAGVVLSFGVNDTMFESGISRVAADDTVTNLRILLQQLNEARWSVMMAGPPAVDDERHNERIVALDASMAVECDRQSVPYFSVVRQLQGHGVWRREVRDGDGAHPGAAGYEALATLLRPAWDKWLLALRTARSSS
ncbi:GDSL-type esterase/lipase family protein [Arthrobacter sp. TMN-49]